MGDGFGPGNRMRDIDPDGGAASDASGAGAWGRGDANDAHAGPGARAVERELGPIAPGAGRGRRFVRSTTGGEPTPGSSDRGATAGPTPLDRAAFDGAPPAERAAAYETPRATPRRGKRAVRAHRERIAERRRLEAERAAAEANVEARGAAGFRTRDGHAARVTMSNPGYAPSPMYEAGDPAAPDPGKPWYRRLVVLIPAAVLVVAGLVAGIGIPALAQAAATSRADAAAATFTRGLAEYHSAWTAENLDALVAAQPHLGIAEAPNLLQQPLDAQRRLTEECAVVAAATRAAGTLGDNPPPSLEVLPSASFSAAYRDAQAADAAFAAERLAGQTLLAAVSATIGPLSGLCTNLQAGIAIENQASLRDDHELAPLRTVPEGGASIIDGDTIECTDPLGCVDFADDAARQSYAAAWRSIAEERTLALIAHYRDACWLEVLRPYCTLMSDAWNVSKGGIASIASSLASERPARDAAQDAFPRLTQAITEQQAAFAAVAEQATLAAGGVDPEVFTDQSPGWEARMLARLTAAYESHLEVAVADYRNAVGV